METVKNQYELIALLMKDIDATCNNVEYENVRVSIKNEDWFDIETYLVDMIGNDDITKKFAIRLVNKYVPEPKKSEISGVITAL